MAVRRMPWLLPGPEDLRRRSEAIDSLQGARGEALRELAAHELNNNQLLRLARSLNLARAAGAEAPLSNFTLRLVSNATTDFIVPALEGTGLRHGFALKVEAAPFGVTLQAALSPEFSVLETDPDAILLALDYRAYFADYALRDADADATVDAALGKLRGLVRAFQASSRAAILVQSIVAPPERLFGSFDRRQPGTPAWLVARFNDRLVAEILETGVSLVDVEALAAQVGLGLWYDHTQYMTARLPFADECVPLYAEHVLRLIGAMRGRSRKVLVVDLDNTLWGGVVGEDGVDGIRLGQGDPRGEAFLCVQRAALALKERGVLLAVCSKNDESVARKAIREHPDMLLRESDFSAFQINWTDKATNLKILAERLSLGLASFVFLDDNPFERAQVRQFVPQVMVLELPSDPATYASVLMNAGLFEAVTFSNEDRTRVEQYAGNTRRDTLRAQSCNLSAFLRSLRMQVIFTTGGEAGWPRFAQLINKSNQFNLTTRRYTEAEISAFAADPETLTLQVRLVDQFGDNGMISAVIAVREAADWVLDTWVMSCRVLGREVEYAVLNQIAAEAHARGIRRLIGVYRPTERNSMVREHYAKLGFVRVAATEGEDRWVLDLAQFTARDVPITITRNLVPA
jgi:FkbH-like protein